MTECRPNAGNGHAHSNNWTKQEDGSWLRRTHGGLLVRYNITVDAPREFKKPPKARVSKAEQNRRDEWAREARR